MVSRITTLPKDGTANEQQVENWLAELARFRPQRDIALLREMAILLATHLPE